MKNKVSVIVPVFNVQDYLEECLESLCRQTYSNLEIIVIDDGSTDNSGVICDKYAEKDSRIMAIHQKNGGAASAKNTGLRIATGEYLTFADSDDFVEKDAYEYMVNKLEKTDAEIIQCAFREIYVNESKDIVVLDSECIFDKIDFLKRYTKDWTCGLLWDKMYRRSIFDGIYFEEGHVVDDEFFTYQGVLNAEKVLHEPKVVYNYRKRKSSVTVLDAYKERTIMDKLDYLEQRRNNILEQLPELKQDIEAHYLDMMLMISKDPYISKKCIIRIKKMLKEYFKETNICKITIRKRLNLLGLQYKPVNVLLRNRRSDTVINDLKKYFD